MHSWGRKIERFPLYLSDKEVLEHLQTNCLVSRKSQSTLGKRTRIQALEPTKPVARLHVAIRVLQVTMLTCKQFSKEWYHQECPLEKGLYHNMETTKTVPGRELIAETHGYICTLFENVVINLNKLLSTTFINLWRCADAVF